jgi:hypothetical protein
LSGSIHSNNQRMIYSENIINCFDTLHGCCPNAAYTIIKLAG